MALDDCSISYGHYEIAWGNLLMGLKDVAGGFNYGIIKLLGGQIGGKSADLCVFGMVILVAGGYDRIGLVFRQADLAL